MKLRLFSVVAIVSALITLPAVSSASTAYHPDSTELGYTVYPSHDPSTRSRADLVREVEIAQKNGLIRLSMMGLQPSIPTTKEKTRREVLLELQNMSKSEKLMRSEIYTTN